MDFSEQIRKLYTVLSPVLISFLLAWFLLPIKKKLEKYMTENEMKFYRIDNLEISDIGISTCEKD